VIAERLQSLATSGIVTGTSRYEVTDKGQAFFPVLILAPRQGLRWCSPAGVAPRSPQCWFATSARSR